MDDSVDGIHRLMQSDFRGPVNLGSEEQISIDELARLVMGLMAFVAEGWRSEVGNEVVLPIGRGSGYAMTLGSVDGIGLS
jgi:nucleoside-diphosphate-sugar epimerase